MKKFNFKITLNLLVLNLFLASIISCTQDISEKRAINMTDNLNTELNLNEMQYDSVLNINKKYITKFEKMSKGNNERLYPGKREEFMKVRQEWNQELEEVLTKEQFEKYQENERKQRPQKRPNKN